MFGDVVAAPVDAGASALLRAPELTIEQTGIDSLVLSLTPPTSRATLFDVRVEQPDITAVRVLRTVRTDSITDLAVHGLVPAARTFVSARSANRLGYVSEYGFEAQTRTLASPAVIVEALTTARCVDGVLYTGGCVVFALRGALPPRAKGGRVAWNAFGEAAVRCEVRVPLITAWLDADRTVYGRVQGGPTYATEGAPCARTRRATTDAATRSISFLDAPTGDEPGGGELHVRLTLPANAFVSHATFHRD
jgi:hypothetical protein